MVSNGRAPGPIPPWCSCDALVASHRPVSSSSMPCGYANAHPSASLAPDRMNLKQLQYLVAVADEGGFRQGAARLRIAQPALSRQVQNIERELGLQLFDRNSRKVSLTPAGEAFLRGGRLVL